MVKRLSLVLLLLAAFAPRVSSSAEGALSVQIQPPEVQQGRTSLIRVAADPDVTAVEVTFAGKQFPLYRSVDGDWVGFLAADMTSERGTFPVQIVTWNGDHANPPQTEEFNVIWGAFLYQDIALPNSLVPLLDPELNQSENLKLTRIYSRYTPQKLWTGNLQPPVAGPMISEFGGIRSYNNGALEGRHTGTDFRAGLGEPVGAAGAGRVVFANYLPVRGNHIVIDHGMGVLTGYSHLSEIYVVPGQRVLAGDVIGAVGSTGRTQGAHSHFEVAVNGSWVDPVQFLQLQIPDAAPAVATAG